MDPSSSLPPGLRLSRPREVRLTPGGKVVIGLIAVLTVLNVGISVTLAAQRRTERAADAALVNGRSANATVLRLWRSGDKNKHAMASYRFVVDGESFSGQSSLPLAQWQALDQGSVLPIRYATGRPSVSRPEGVAPGGIPAFVPPFVAVMFLLPCVVLGYGLKTERQLLANGIAARGVVTSQTRRRSSEGGTQLIIKYEFATSSGQRQRGATSNRRRAPAIGSPIWVLYDSERPKRNRPYPFQFVRPE
jgi:hypothetical protein